MSSQPTDGALARRSETFPSQDDDRVTRLDELEPDGRRIAMRALIQRIANDKAELLDRLSRR